MQARIWTIWTRLHRFTRQIEGVQIGITLTEKPDGTVRVSVRTTKGRWTRPLSARRSAAAVMSDAAGASFTCGMAEAKGCYAEGGRGAVSCSKSDPERHSADEQAAGLYLARCGLPSCAVFCTAGSVAAAPRPMATGVLRYSSAGATKAADFAAAQDKEYVAGFTLGYCTDTQDVTGEMLQTSERYAAE